MPAVTAARVTVIPAKKDRLPINVLSNEARKLRVAAYARVSTNNERRRWTIIPGTFNLRTSGSL